MRSILGIVAVLAATVLTTSGTADAHPAHLSAAPAATTATGPRVTVETYRADNKTLVSRQTFGAGTQGRLMGAAPTGKGAAKAPAGSGDGGSSSASGCRKVTVSNEEETLLGFTAFWFDTWTRWCWTRSSQTVYDVTHGWATRDVDSAYEWQGIANKDFEYYDFSTNDGHPRSAFKNYRQGHFKNCIPIKGCIGSYYPANTLRSYYNGTWAWSTGG